MCNCLSASCAMSGMRDVRRLLTGSSLRGDRARVLSALRLMPGNSLIVSRAVNVRQRPDARHDAEVILRFPSGDACRRSVAPVISGGAAALSVHLIRCDSRSSIRSATRRDQPDSQSTGRIRASPTIRHGVGPARSSVALDRLSSEWHSACEGSPDWQRCQTELHPRPDTLDRVTRDTASPMRLPRVT